MLDLEAMWYALHPNLKPTIVQGDFEETLIGHDKYDDINNLYYPYTVTELMYHYLDIKDYGKELSKAKYRRAEVKRVIFTKDGKVCGPYYAKVFMIYAAKGEVHYAVYFKDEWKLYKYWEIVVQKMDDVWDMFD